MDINTLLNKGKDTMKPEYFYVCVFERSRESWYDSTIQGDDDDGVDDDAQSEVEKKLLSSHDAYSERKSKLKRYI